MSEVTVLICISLCIQSDLRGHHVCDWSSRGRDRCCDHTLLPTEDRACRPAGVCRQYAGLCHLHLPHLRRGQEEHRRSICKCSLEWSWAKELRILALAVQECWECIGVKSFLIQHSAVSFCGTQNPLPSHYLVPPVNWIKVIPGLRK